MAKLCLGIESTAHTFGVGIVNDKGKVLSNVKDVYTTTHGGIVPLEAAKHHKQVKEQVLKEALEEAGISLKDIGLIAYSCGPGLPPCLLQGLELAKSLARKLKLKLSAVNHCIAHLEIGRLLTKAEDPVLLYVSGANTQIIAYTASRYRIFGETLDVGIGNAIDTFARYAGIGFPGGPRIEELARSSVELIELPYSVKGMDVAFSGMLTNLKQKLESKKYKLEDLAFSFQEHAFAMLVEVSERALAHLKKNELLLGGGVACNARLQQMCSIMCKERKAKVFVPPSSFLVDNGAMIAWTGLLMAKTGQLTNFKEADIKPYQRTDEVNISWR